MVVAPGELGIVLAAGPTANPTADVLSFSQGW